MKSVFFCSAFLCSLFSFAQNDIIPKPVRITTTEGEFILSENTSLLFTDVGEKASAGFLNEYLRNYYGFTLKTDSDTSGGYIRISTKKFIQAPDNPGHYTLVAGKNSIHIEGDSYQGTFYGIQSLIQLLPVEKEKILKIPAVSIDDQPRFVYRGLHLDAARHFFPVEFIKKYIDYIALHKMNYFHWHLTEDQGWRIEIKKYPKLTETGAYRNGTIIGRYPGTGNDNKRYGGFYTQEEIKDIVSYASERFITIIPEIEMPGHAMAALASYPHLGCTGGPYQVQQTWGVFDDVFCAGNDSVFTFLQDVMDEVIALFPSEYIHIGGDESPKTNWKKCPRCQARIKTNNLKDVHELQSYFIQRMEKYINSKGRTIIGWDEILEGGLAPNAIVMSWRGEAGGIEAAKQNHPVIMTPGSHMYFDHSQTRNEDSVTFGGFTSLDKVYNYEPIPSELNEEQGKYILGAQANVWTEYIKNTSKVEYQVFPRISALSEVLWSPKQSRNWMDFEKRLQKQFKRYDLWGINYSKAYFELKTRVLPSADGKGVVWKLENSGMDGDIRYTTDSSLKNLFNYDQPVVINKSTKIGASLFTDGKPVKWIWQHFNVSKATGKKVHVSRNPSPNYPGNGGISGLVNGIRSEKGISSSEWLGWNEGNPEIVVDLGSLQTVSNVNVHVLESNGSWIYFPSKVEVYLSSNGNNFKKAGETSAVENEHSGMGIMNVTFTRVGARYVKIKAVNFGIIPEGRSGAGHTSWVFADEVEIN